MRTTEWLEAREKRKRMWVERLNYTSAKFHAICWVLASLYVLYQSNFFYVIWTSEATNTVFFGISLMLFGIFVTLVVYAAFLLPGTEEVEVTAPSLIPIASAVGCLCFLTSLIAFWPVWGWYTPVILVVLQVGYLMLGSFLPKSSWGSLMTALVFVAALCATWLIPHEGLLHN